MVAIGPVVDLLGGSPLVLPLDGIVDDGQTLTFTATSDNPNVTIEIPEGNRSMRISVRAPTGRSTATWSSSCSRTAFPA